MISTTAQRDILRDLRLSAREEKLAIAKYAKRASYVAKYSLGIAGMYKGLIVKHQEHYKAIMQRIREIRRLR